METNNSRYFLTVEWCNDGQRGIFCSASGSAFPKEGESHKLTEMHEILGPFWMILDPRSDLLSEDQVAEYTRFRPLGEYSHAYGIALKGGC